MLHQLFVFYYIAMLLCCCVIVMLLLKIWVLVVEEWTVDGVHVSGWVILTLYYYVSSLSIWQYMCLSVCMHVLLSACLCSYTNTPIHQYANWLIRHHSYLLMYSYTTVHSGVFRRGLVWVDRHEPHERHWLHRDSQGECWYDGSTQGDTRRLAAGYVITSACHTLTLIY